MRKEVGRLASAPGAPGAGVFRLAVKGRRVLGRLRLRPLYAGVLVWAGVFGLLWVFG